MSDKTIRIMGAVLIGVPGIYLLCQVDWKIALGVFLCMWGNNINPQR